MATGSGADLGDLGLFFGVQGMVLGYKGTFWGARLEMTMALSNLQQQLWHRFGDLGLILGDIGGPVARFWGAGEGFGVQREVFGVPLTGWR